MSKIDWGKTLTSKTFYLGLLTIAIGILEYLNNVPIGASIVTVLIGCLGVVLRFLTKDAIIKS